MLLVTRNRFNDEPAESSQTRFGKSFIGHIDYLFQDLTMVEGTVYDNWIEAVGLNGERTGRVNCGQLTKPDWQQVQSTKDW